MVINLRQLDAKLSSIKMIASHCKLLQSMQVVTKWGHKWTKVSIGALDSAMSVYSFVIILLVSVGGSKQEAK